MKTMQEPRASIRHDLPVGSRVGAVQDYDPDTGTLNLYGYGVYEGRHQAPMEDGETKESIREAVAAHMRHSNPSVSDSEIDEVADSFINNPKIKLDNGCVVWGRECWWEEEGAVLAIAARCKQVSIVKTPDEVSKLVEEAVLNPEQTVI